jgi:hypothetical protein
MAIVLSAAPTPGLNEQGWLADDGAGRTRGEVYETMTCAQRVRAGTSGDPATGRVLGAEE